MKMARWLLAAVAVVCALGHAASGATYYVDATNGDDTKDGQTAAIWASKWGNTGVLKLLARSSVAPVSFVPAKLTPAIAKARL